MKSEPILKAVVIDDESNAINVLVKFLDVIGNPKVKVSGTATNLEDGIDQINKTKPDIVFLDIDMPNKNGLAIFDNFKDPDFKVIFVTAYKEYAIEALKKSASDYLLKPINIVELKESIQRVAHQIEKEAHKLELSEKINLLGSLGIDGKDIIFDVNGGFVVENTRDIEYCYADHVYSVVVTYSGKEILVTKPLKQLQEILPNGQFYRSHRSYLVNIHYIKQFVRGRECLLILKSGSKIPVSVRTSTIILKDLKQLLQS